MKVLCTFASIIIVLHSFSTTGNYAAVRAVPAAQLQQTVPPGGVAVCPGSPINYTCVTDTHMKWRELGSSDTATYVFNLSHIDDTEMAGVFTTVLTDISGITLTSTATIDSVSLEDARKNISCTGADNETVSELVQVQGPPVAPSNLTIDILKNTKKLSVNLTWSGVPCAKLYYVEDSTNNYTTTTNTTTASQYTQLTLRHGLVYSFRVRAADSINRLGEWSESIIYSPGSAIPSYIPVTVTIIIFGMILLLLVFILCYYFRKKQNRIKCYEWMKNKRSGHMTNDDNEMRSQSQEVRDYGSTSMSPASSPTAGADDAGVHDQPGTGASQGTCSSSSRVNTPTASTQSLSSSPCYFTPPQSPSPPPIESTTSINTDTRTPPPPNASTTDQSPSITRTESPPPTVSVSASATAQSSSITHTPPPTGTDTISQFQFMETVASKIPAKWRIVGVSLGISVGVLDGIENHRNKHPLECFTDVFTYWQQQSTPQNPVNWATLVTVLRSDYVGEKYLSYTIHETYCKALQQTVTPDVASSVL